MGDVIFDHPSRLAEMLVNDELDVALVPAFEALRGGASFRVVDEVSIASEGAVYSVFLAYRGCLNDVKTIALDPASLTSANLLRCLVAEFHPQLRPEFVTEVDADAHLLIGNQAIHFRQEHPADDWQYLDLGEEWLRRTGLPFVFAVWLIRAGVPNAEAVADALRALKQTGLARIRQIADEQTEFDADFAARYLTGNIRFGFGKMEKAGVEKFRELLLRRGLIAPRDDCALQFV
jgi:chorismate dehydratase